MTSIRIDLRKQIDAGELDQETAKHLLALAERPHWIRILQLLGVIMGSFFIVGGLTALSGSPIFLMIISALALGVSYLLWFYNEDDKFIAQSVQTLGTLGLIAGFLWYLDMLDIEPTQVGTFIVFALISILFAITAWSQTNVFLGALFVISLGYNVGLGAGDWEIDDTIWTEHSSLTVVVYGATFALMLWLRKRSSAARRLLFTVGGYVAFFVTMLGFWIGSLGGDRYFLVPGTGQLGDDGIYVSAEYQFVIPDLVFIIGWAVFLIVMIIYGAKRDNGFVRNTAIVFLGIHGFTQLLLHNLENGPVLLSVGSSIFALAILSSIYFTRKWKTSQRI